MRKQIATIMFVLSAALPIVSQSKQSISTASEIPQWEIDAGGKMSFDVTSVKLNTDGHTTPSAFPVDSSDRYNTGDTTRFSSTNSTLSGYINFAYKLSGYQYDSLKAQLPKWAIAEKFDIEAKAAAPSTKDQMRLMMQSLLADRFHLKAHFETNERPVFALVLVKPGQTGPQLHHFEDDPPCDAPAPSGPNARAMMFEVGRFPSDCDAPFILNAPPTIIIGARKVGMARVAQSLYTAPTANFDRPVIDRTGLSGSFDFVLKYTGNILNPAAGVAAQDAGGITFLEALKDRLGMKLDSTKAPVQQLVVDHIEEPTAN